jgi:hypothetical protein
MQKLQIGILTFAIAPFERDTSLHVLILLPHVELEMCQSFS